MKLLGSPASPYARKARLVLLEKNIPHDYQVDAPREAGSVASKTNPLARIPVLILDDGSCLFDSPVIAEYADSLNDSPVLIPRHDPLMRARVKCLEALADGVMDAAVAIRIESLRPDGHQDAAALTRHRTAISRSLSVAADSLGRGQFLFGTALSLADLALVSALLYVDFRLPETGWRDHHPTLQAWFERMQARSAVQDSLAQ